MPTRSRVLGLLFVPAAVVVLTLLLHAISPWRQPGPLIRLQVGPEYETAAAFDSRALRCSEQELSGRGDALRLRAMCSVEIAGEELLVRVQHRGVMGTCEASYRGEALPCESAVPFYNSDLPAVIVRSNLGLDSASLRSLPGTNPLFYLSESFWQRLQLALAALIALAATLLLLRSARPAQGSALRAVARGAGVAGVALAVWGVTWYALLWSLLVSGLVD